MKSFKFYNDSELPHYGAAMKSGKHYIAFLAFLWIIALLTFWIPLIGKVWLGVASILTLGTALMIAWRISQGKPAFGDKKKENKNTNKEYKGYNGTLILNDNNIVIKKGLKGFLLGGGFIRGDKTIPYHAIVAVQLKKAGLTAGYLQLTLKGGSEAKGGLFQSALDENSINFYRSRNKDFEEAKKIIEEKISSQTTSQNNGLDQLEQLAALKEKGIITEEEFTEKKKQILGL